VGKSIIFKVSERRVLKDIESIQYGGQKWIEKRGKNRNMGSVPDFDKRS
jgi:hypothetical protein